MMNMIGAPKHVKKAIDAGVDIISTARRSTITSGGDSLGLQLWEVPLYGWLARSYRNATGTQYI